MDKLKNNCENENPKNIKFLSDIVNDSYAHCNLDNSFTIFKSINDILYLIYANKKSLLYVMI